MRGKLEMRKIVMTIKKKKIKKTNDEKQSKLNTIYFNPSFEFITLRK